MKGFVRAIALAVLTFAVSVSPAAAQVQGPGIPVPGPAPTPQGPAVGAMITSPPAQATGPTRKHRLRRGRRHPLRTRLLRRRTKS